MVVKFVRRTVRDDVYAARMKLATHNRSSSAGTIYINEDLPPAKGKLFAELRKLVNNKRLLGAWLKNNKLFVKTTNGSIKKNVLSVGDIDLNA